MPRINLSENDIENVINSVDLDKFNIFREYVKLNNKFVSTNNFFISSHNDNNSDDEKYIKIYGNNNEKYIEKNNDIYFIHYKTDYNDEKVINEIKKIDLIIIKNLKLEMNNQSLDIKNLIKNEEISNNECDELIKDLYYTSFYYKKFNINNEVESKENKKYFFKIKKGEINIKNQIEQCQLNI